MLKTSKHLIVPGRKATRPNLFHLDTFLFTAYFPHFNCFFCLNPSYPFLYLEIIFSQTCPLPSLMYLSCNMGKLGFFTVEFCSREDLGFSFAG